MLDFDAPIVPGESAAGIRVGSRIAELPADVLARFTVERRVNPCLPNAVLTVYRSDAITLTVENRVIDQVEVRGGYRGRLKGAIGIGSTVAEVEDCVGPVIADDEDNLCIDGLSGLVFELAGAVERDIPAGDPILRPLPIRRIFVYRT
jgi:hypothetical protein